MALDTKPTKTTKYAPDYLDLGAVETYFSRSPAALPFQRSQAGSTGITFLPIDSKFNWLVKWQNHSLSEVEYICSQFYKRTFTHLSIPQTIYSMPEQLRKKLFDYFQKEKVLEGHFPILMEYKDGNTLKKFIENGNFFELSAEDRVKMFASFGEISGYDFMIGNCDRFIPANFRGEINDRFKANTGNFLIELEAPTDSGILVEKKSLKTVHFIDNTPHLYSFFELSERSKAPLSAKDDDFCLDMDLIFKNGGTEGVDTPPIEASALPAQERGRLPTGDELREQRLDDFKYYFNANDKQLKLLTHQIALGIKNELQDTLVNQKGKFDFIFNEMDADGNICENAIFKGLLAARKNIIGLNPSIMGSLSGEITSSSSKANIIVQKFISRVLTFVRGVVA